jgi:hypothetical protein
MASPTTTTNGTPQAPATAAVPVSTPAPPKKTEWQPHMWEGMSFGAWLRLMWRNRCAVWWPYWYVAGTVTLVSFMHSLITLLQEAIFGRKIRATPIVNPPIFVIGHWRTGTTLLHELLALDDRHTYPTTYECLSPHHFLLTEKLFTRIFCWLMPSQRPMDNMKMGYDRPQEDEFALCMLGQPSPYLTIAFPNHLPQDQEFLSLENVRPTAVARWKKALLHFYQQITFKNRKRLVLKSPPHTCRIPVLQQLFPGAVFINIVRDPYVVFPSTVNLWKSLYKLHGLQKPTYQGLEKYVLETGWGLFKRLEETRDQVAPERFHEVKYEDLVSDPVGQMQALYEHLGLGGFEQVRPRLEAYFAAQKDYQTNRYQLTEDQRAEVTESWGRFFERYGYIPKPKEAPPIPIVE